MIERLRLAGATNSDFQSRQVIEQLAERHRWDECLAVVEAIPQNPATITELIERSLEELLASGRIATVRRWIEAARDAKVDDGVLDLADSEIALRGGDYDRALAFGTRAADRLVEGDFPARAWLVAARAAHLSDRSAMAADLFKAARSSAVSTSTCEAALWGQFLAEGEQRGGFEAATLESFQAAGDGSIDHEIRSALGRALIYVFRGNAYEALDIVERAKPLLSLTNDPLVRLSWLNQYAWTLGSPAHYPESLARAEELAQEATDSGLEFAVNHGLIAKSRALIGLRRFAEAHDTLAHLERRLRNEPDAWATTNATIQYARLEISVGNLERAAEYLMRSSDDCDNRTTRAEQSAYRALVAAARGDDAEAERSIAISRNTSRHSDSENVVLLAEALLALSSDPEKVLGHFRAVWEKGQADFLVMACRASRRFAAEVAQDAACREALREILTRSSDEGIARSIGIRIPRVTRRSGVLSPRELEVYELLVQGRTNPEIAQALFISESTTKVHVKHILEKLGLRSRVEAARAWRTGETIP